MSEQPRRRDNARLAVARQLSAAAHSATEARMMGIDTLMAALGRPYTS